MRYYLRVRGSYKWHDITKYVQDPTILNITVDGSYMQLDMVARFPTSVDFFDVKKPIPPKWEIRVRDESELEEELVNTYYFITDNQSSLNKRKEVKENNNVVIDGLYEHKITGNNRLYLLEGKYAPNYTVTQPKTKYFDVYRKSGGGRFVINQKLQEDGEVKVLAEGNKVLLPDRNNDDNTITIGYDSEEQKHYIEVKDIDKRTFSINFEIALQKTAKGKIRYKELFIPRTAHVNTSFGDSAKLKFQKYYYTDQGRSSREPEELDLSYDGGFVDYTGYPSPVLLSFGQQKVISASTTIQRHIHSNKARLYFSYISTQNHNVVFNRYLGLNGPINTDIIGTDSNSFVKANIISLQVTATSSAYESALENEKYTTLYELLEKAVFDYNLNSRDKLYLNDNDLEVKLAVPVKESEWGDYNYKELIERIFKYVGLSPYLTKDNLITYIRQNKLGASIDVEQEGLNQKEHKGEFFYDRAISNSKNLVSEQDFITEVLPITSIDEEFSQLTSDTVGFLASNDIYFLSNAILYAPNLVIDFGNVEVKSNTNKDFYWDITSRLFESDIYNSFPDVRYDVKGEKINGNYIDLRSMPDKYSKSNVISYKSGSNVISNLGHLAPRIPTFTGLEILTGTPEYLDPQYSVIEMLIVLAYSQLTAEQIEETSDPKPIDSNLSGDIKMSIISDFELEITYAPIYKELTTKHSSNMKDRRGLNFEKKFNMTNKTISYDESSKVLRNEMESKGNVKILHSNTVKKLSDTLPINSIINDNLYLVTKTMSLHKNKIDVDYILQENFLLQNEDISLPVAFDRFEVPYEYVNREVMLDNHLIFDTNVMLGLIDKRAVNKAFLQKVFLDNDFEGTIYGKAELDRLDESNLEVLLRMGVIKTDFSMIMSGRFLDNYSAGVQRYAYNEGDYNLLYSQPYRYTNAKGKLYAVNGFSVGWDDAGNSLRLNDYDVRTFPEGKDVNNFQTELFNFEERLLLYKDAREALSFVHTSYLESNNEDIKFYSFNKINGIGILLNDIVFRDDLTLEEIDYTEVENGIDEITFEELGTNHFQVRLRLSSPNIYNFPNGLILFNKDETEYSLVGLIKNFYYEDTKTIIFYITSSRYGVMPTELLGDTVLSELVELYSDSEVSYVSGTTIDLESNFTTLALLNMGATHTVLHSETFDVEPNLEYVNGEVISLNNDLFMNTQFTEGLSFAKQLDNNIELENNILILNGTIIDLNSNIYGNMEMNKGISRTKSYILKYDVDNELDYVSGEVVELENNLYGNVEIGEGYTYKGNYNLDFDTNSDIMYIQGDIINLDNMMFNSLSFDKRYDMHKTFDLKPKIDNELGYVSGEVIELESVVVTSFSTITYSPVPPSTTASSGNYGQVLTGADGYSQWECMRTSENIMNWVENGTTDDVNVPIVNEGGSCYTWLDSGRGRFFVDLEAQVYVRYLCEVTSVEHTYYWEIVS